LDTDGSISLDSVNDESSTSDTVSVDSSSRDNVDDPSMGSVDTASYADAADWKSSALQSAHNDIPRFKPINIQTNPETGNVRMQRLKYMQDLKKTKVPDEDDLLRCIKLDPDMAVSILQPQMGTALEKEGFVLKAMDAAFNSAGYFGTRFKISNFKKYIPSNHFNNREVMMKACFYDTDFVAFVPDVIRNKDFLLQLLETKPTEAKNILKNAPPIMKTDENFLANFIDKDPTAISVVPNNFREVSKTLLRALHKDPVAIVSFLLPKKYEQGVTNIGGRKTRQKRKRTRRRRTRKSYY